jgi:PAS domain S-box-containing protein
MDEFWRQALQPALRIWRHGESLRCEPNAAARQWALEQGLDEAAQALAWQALAPRVLAAPDAQRRAWQLAPDLGAREGPAFEAQALACADGALLAWLPPTTAPVGVLSALDAGGVGVWRRAFGQGSFWSEAMYRLRGLSPADPRSPDELAMICLHPEDRAQWQQMVQRYAQRPPAPGVREAHEWEFRVVWPDGSVHWLVSRGRTVCDEQGRPAYMTGVNLDVTERRKAQALTLENERLAQLKRTQSEFLARVSHELRTPMNAVLGFAQLMSYDTAEPLSPRQSERLARIDEAGRHLLALIDDVLDLARIDADRQTLVDEPVPLDALVREALGWVSDQALAAGISLRLARPHLPGRVRGDKRRLGQVLVNLLTNAIKYNRRQGWVEVDTRGSSAGWAEEASSEWALVVRDSGRGMAADARQRIFEPFNRLGAELEGIAGTGIGLTIVRQLTERMGGRIEVDSEPGVGSEFRVWLPADQEDTRPAPLDELPVLSRPQPVGGAGQRLKLLCIEDNPANLLLVRELLALRPQFEFSSADCGRAGLALALQQRPDVILLDMQLPDLHGSQVLRALRLAPELAHCKVIALSANAMSSDIQTAMDQGFDDYWTKPLEMGRFLRGLDDLLEERL